MKRSLNIFLSGLPFLIILGLLYAAFFIKPSVSGNAVPPPIMARGDYVYGVSAIGLNHALWAAGNDGKVWLSEDMAMSWKLQPTPIKDTLQDLAAWNREQAVAVGNEGVILVTGDGGKIWNAVPAPRSQIANKLVRVRVYPNGEAWAVGEVGMVLRSQDYGHTWTRMAPEEDSGWNDVYKVGANIVLAGEFGRIRLSPDGGITWKDAVSPVKGSLMALAFKDELVGVAVGLDGAVLVTNDGGKSWLEQRRVTHAHLFDVIWDGARWVATGNNGVLLFGDATASNWKASLVSRTNRSWHTRIITVNDSYLVAGQKVDVVHRAMQ
jgi:photosystem II stability/assembly factor-like uncharacterized protein